MSSRPRVVVLTPNLSGFDGISRLSRLVASTFDDVVVLALHEPSTPTAWEHADLRGADGRTSRYVAAAVRCARAAGPDTSVVAVHLHLAPAGLAFTARGASLTVMLCGVEAWKPLTWMQRAALDRADRVIAISAHTRRRFVEANPHFASRAIDVCHPGIPPRAAGAPAAPIDRGGNRAPAALIVGRLAADERYKGHDALLEVWRDVLAEVPGVTLRVAGDGDDRARLEAKAGALGLGGVVSFLGRVDEDDLDREYERAAAFVMPSRDEGFGFVFVEAMRAGRACIGSFGAAAEIIDDGGSGLLVDPDDRAALTRAVVRLLGDRAEADRMGAQGRARYLQHFTAHRFRHRFTALVDARVAALAECGSPE